MNFHFRTALLGSLAGLGLLTASAADLGGAAMPPVNAPVDCMAALEDVSDFEAIARHLEPGGSNYMILNLQNFGKLMSPWLDQFSVQLQEEQLLGPMFSMSAAGGAMQIKQITTLLGVDAIEGYGSSEINLGTQEQALYSSRDFLYTGNNPREGILWDLLGQNQNVKALAATLPANLHYGCVWRPNITAAIQKLRTLLPPEQPMPPELEQILQTIGGLSGQVTLALTPDAAGKTALWAVVPDKGNQFYNFLGQMLQKNPQVKFTMASMEIPMPEQTQQVYAFDRLFLKKGPESLIVMTSAGLDEFIAGEIAAGRTLAASEEFRKLSAGLPEEAAAILYIGSNGFSEWQNFSNKMMPLPQLEQNQNMLSVYTLQTDGMADYTMSFASPQQLALKIVFAQWQQMLPIIMGELSTADFNDDGDRTEDIESFDDGQADTDDNAAQEE